MKKILNQFSELRKTMPRNVQWLALAVAFIVVLILMTMLLRDSGNDASVPTDTDTPAPDLIVTPDSIDWSKTMVNTRQSMKITVAATAPVTVTAVRASGDMPGLIAPKTTCTNIGEINDKISCTIDVQYAPTAAADARAMALFIDWRGADMPDTMTQTQNIPIVLGARADTPKPAADPAPTASPEPDPIPEPTPEHRPIRDEIERDIAAISPDLGLDDIWNTPDTPAIADTPKKGGRGDDNSAPAPAKTDDYTPAPESCSDFAFPGYNNAGTQIGWIRPEHGTYYFHPFADRDCNAPTGVYNPDNGIITAIDNPSQKIGTDAENIGYNASITTGTLPQLSNPATTRTQNRARQLTTDELAAMPMSTGTGAHAHIITEAAPEDVKYTSSGETIVSSMPYDRSFILRQYKPIPATIVSEVRADEKTLHARGLPVRATVDRNVYSDDGRTIIIPTGTLMLGYVTGNLPGPYKAIGRMEIEWYQFIRPDGVEFNFPKDQNPFSGDAQGRVGVPGHGSTDYLEQFVMPMLTAIVPAAVNLIAPISDRFVNQIDLDNNTVVQSGQVRSSELAKNEIITAWNQVAQKLMVDMMDNTVPPFSIAAGTRITVFSPVDLLVTCGAPGSSTKKCAIAPYGSEKRFTQTHSATPDYTDGTWTGQVRSFNLDGYCDDSQPNKIRRGAEAEISSAGLDYRTVLFYCQSKQYKAINNAKQEAIFENQQQTSLTDSTGSKLINNTQKYNEEVLGLTYNDDNTIQNPFTPTVEEAPIITCEDGTVPDGNGCCTGEIYTDMGDQGFNCCPETGGDCFPPIL